MADVVTNHFKAEVMRGTLSLGSDQLNLALLDSNHSNDIDNDSVFSDVNGDEISGSGYSAGGQAIANTGVTQDNTDNEGVLDGDDVTWANSSITARYGVVYHNATGTIVAILDFGQDKTSSNGEFKVSFAGEGIVNLG